MKTFVLLMLLAAPAAWADEANMSLVGLRQTDLQILGIAGAISLVSYQLNLNNLDFNFNPLTQKLTLNIKF